MPVMRNADLLPGSATGTRHEVMDLDVLGDSLAAGACGVDVRFSLSQPEAVLTLRAGNVTLER